MGIKGFTIEFDRDIYYPDEEMTGRVDLTLGEPKFLQAAELKICGKAKCHWTSSNGKKAHHGEEIIFSNKKNLAGANGKFELPSGTYTYPFSITLPSSVPPTYRGKYGSIIYYGKATLDTPWLTEESTRKEFLMGNFVNLNNIADSQSLKLPHTEEGSAGWKLSLECCLTCCLINKPVFTILVNVPQRGFAYNETIPVSVQINAHDNSNLQKAIAKIIVQINQKITWNASDNSSFTELITLKNYDQDFNNVENDAQGKFQYFLNNVGHKKLPISEHCRTIQIGYELKIIVIGKRFRQTCTLSKISVPIIFGDIGFDFETTRPVQEGSQVESEITTENLNN